jgi:hypothetical protein
MAAKKKKSRGKAGSKKRKGRKPAKRKAAKKTAKRKAAPKRKVTAKKKKKPAPKPKMAVTLAPAMERMRYGVAEMGQGAMDAGRMLGGEAKDAVKDAQDKVKEITTDWMNRNS